MRRTARRRVATGLMLAILVAACGGCISHPRLGVKAISTVDGSAPVKSGWGCGVSLTGYEEGLVAGVVEFVDMELEDGSDLLQSRLYLKLNIPFAAAMPGWMLVAAIGPVAGVAFSDADGSAGWDAGNAVLYGGELTFALNTNMDAVNPFIFINVRHLRADWDLEHDSHTTKRMAVTEIAVGMAWEF